MYVKQTTIQSTFLHMGNFNETNISLFTKTYDSETPIQKLKKSCYDSLLCLSHEATVP